MSTRTQFQARFPHLKALNLKGEDVTEKFLKYLIEDNIESGSNEAEKAEIANAVAMVI